MFQFQLNHDNLYHRPCPDSPCPDGSKSSGALELFGINSVSKLFKKIIFWRWILRGLFPYLILNCKTFAAKLLQQKFQHNFLKIYREKLQNRSNLSFCGPEIDGNENSEAGHRPAGIGRELETKILKNREHFSKPGTGGTGNIIFENRRERAVTRHRFPSISAEDERLVTSKHEHLKVRLAPSHVLLIFVLTRSKLWIPKVDFDLCEIIFSANFCKYRSKHKWTRKWSEFISTKRY